MLYSFLSCLTDGSGGTPEIPALAFANAYADAPFPKRSAALALSERRTQRPDVIAQRMEASPDTREGDA